MKIIVLIMCIGLGIVSCQISKIRKKTANNLKDYALCLCLIEGYKKDSIDLRDVSISVLYELSDYSIDLSHRKAIDSLTISIVNEMRPLQPGDYGNKKAVIFNCLQYYKGQKLKQFINSLK